MKKFVLVCFFSLVMLFCVSAQAGNRAVSVGMGYGGINYSSTSIGSYSYVDRYWGGGFAISLGYEQEVFDHVLFLGQVAFVTGNVKTHKTSLYNEGTLLSTTTATGKAREIHALIGVAYKYTFNNIVSVQAGLTLDSQSIDVYDMEAKTTIVATDTTTTTHYAYAAANHSLGFTSNVSYLINNHLSVGVDFSIGLSSGVLVGAALRYNF